MKRKIVSIDSGKCTGCGACADACQEGAIEMRGGKAVLVRDDYCDGLGNCLPVCPADAITIIERDAPPFDANAKCSGSQPSAFSGNSELSHWPVQIKLVPVKAGFFDGDLLIASDCSAFAYRRFHDDFIKGRATVIGCPKLDSTDYAEKLSQILMQNDVRSVKVARMEVPCCGGLVKMVSSALEMSGKDIPMEIVTISSKGDIVSPHAPNAVRIS